jgi:hypothetical protein
MTRLLVIAFAACATLLTACGSGTSTKSSGGSASSATAQAGSSASSAVPSSGEDAQFKKRVRQEWNAPGATDIASDASPGTTSARMKVATRLIDLDGPGPIRDYRSAQDLLGPPLRRSASNRQWTYLLSRREPSVSPGDVCTREFQVHFNGSGTAISLAADDGEDCASDHRRPLRPHSK